MAKIFVSRKIPGDSLKPLVESDNEVVVSDYDRPLEPGEFLEKAAGCDAVMTLLTDRIDGEVMDAIGPQLKLISNYAVGFDNIVVPDATSRGIVVTNTPSDEVNEAVAEHAWALTLALTRRVVEADESTRRGSYRGWEPSIFLGPSLNGKTYGILGIGRIGSMAARKAQGFGMNVVYYNRSQKPELEQELGIKYLPLEEFWAQSDVITIHLPLTDETRHMINAETLAKMKKGVYIVNTARGAIIQEQDLVNSIREGHVGGAGLDVFDNEPNINPELIAMENVILTPHIASATWEARNKMGEQAVNAIFSVMSDQKPENLVNEDAWKNRRK